MSRIMPTITSMPVDEIEVSDRLRATSDSGVMALMNVIEEFGFTSPIHVRRERGKTFLIDGAHRLEAMKRLGHTEITVVAEECTTAEARLKELAGNLAGASMTPLDDAVFLAEWKRVYEDLHPESRRGAAGGKARQGQQTTKLSFAELVAEKRAISLRKAQRLGQAGQGLTPELVRHLRNGVTAPTPTDLQALAKAKPEQRETIVTLFATGQVKNIAAAIDSLKPAKLQPSEQTRQLTALRDAWKRAGIPARREFVAEFKDDLSQGDLSEVWGRDA